MNVLVKVPATSANLGPGFDALGLALDLWNETEFTPAESFALKIEGEGARRLVANEKNLIARSARRLYECVKKQMPPLHVRCINRIPLSSGLGSSAAAILTGLLGANALLGAPLTQDEILNLAAEIEGHPDNVAPALLGGLVVSTLEQGRVHAHKLTLGPGEDDKAGMAFHITIALPEFSLPTKQARAVLLTEAFRTGDLQLLGQAMTDTLHQPYRLPLIPGAREALAAARGAGAAAALSGAGPAVIAFSADRSTGLGGAMRQCFESAGLRTRLFELDAARQGAQIDIDRSS